MNGWIKRLWTQEIPSLSVAAVTLSEGEKKKEERWNKKKGREGVRKMGLEQWDEGKRWGGVIYWNGRWGKCNEDEKGRTGEINEERECNILGNKYLTVKEMQDLYKSHLFLMT